MELSNQTTAVLNIAIEDILPSKAHRQQKHSKVDKLDAKVFWVILVRTALKEKNQQEGLT